MLGYLLLTILLLSLAAYGVGEMTARRFAATGAGPLHSLPSYHGAFVAVWVGVPALALVILWLMFQGSAIDGLLLRSLPDALTEGASRSETRLLLSEIHNVAVRRIGDRTEVSLHLKLPGDLSLGEAHGIASRVERAIAEAVPGSRLAVIGDAGHHPQFEQPDAWLDAVMSFLDEVDREQERTR